MTNARSKTGPQPWCGSRFRPDGTLAAGRDGISGDDGRTVRVPVTAAAVSPDGRAPAPGSAGSVNLWTPPT